MLCLNFLRGKGEGPLLFNLWKFADSILRMFTPTPKKNAGYSKPFLPPVVVAFCNKKNRRKTIGWSYSWARWRALWIQKLCKTCAKICNYRSLCARDTRTEWSGRGWEMWRPRIFWYQNLWDTYINISCFFFLAGNMLLLFRYTYVYICNCICIFAHKYIESRYTCIIYMYMLSTYTLCLVVGGL